MAERNVKQMDLALQGGGSHGALTWGVLDRLLEDDRIDIPAVSGTSAGAMNAVVMADGLLNGDRDEARQALHDFWKAVSDAARFSPIQRTPLGPALGQFQPRELTLVPSLRSADAGAAAEPAQPVRHQPAARSPGRDHRFRPGQCLHGDQGLRHRDQCADRARPDLPPGRALGRHGDGLGLPALHVQAGRDRRRGLLGRRLYRQSGPLSPGRRPDLPGHRHRPDQPDVPGRAADHGARDHEPGQRAHLQRGADQGAAGHPSPAPADRRRGARDASATATSGCT